MANHVPQPPASRPAVKRVYSIVVATFLFGVGGGLSLAPTLGDVRGLVSFGLIGLAILIMTVAVARWPDPL